MCKLMRLEGSPWALGINYIDQIICSSRHFYGPLLYCLLMRRNWRGGCRPNIRRQVQRQLPKRCAGCCQISSRWGTSLPVWLASGMAHCNNHTKICPGYTKDSSLFHTTVAQMYESRGVHDHYGQKPGKALEVRMVHLGDEGMELMMIVKGKGNSWAVFWLSPSSGLPCLP